MLKYIAGIITGTALTIIGWQKIILSVAAVIKTIITEMGY